MGTDLTRAEERPPSTLPSVVIVDDAVEVRTLVRTGLRLSRKVEVVGEGSSGREAVAMAEKFRPDLLLLDVSMPGMDGLEALPLIRDASPTTRVVMYSGFAEDGLAERTLELGAAAFLEKSSTLEHLADELVRVLHGQPVPSVPVVPSEPARAGAEQWTGTATDRVLREHLERFREVFEDAAIGMATMTLSGRVVRANPSLGRLTGRPVQQLIATSYADLAGDQAVLVLEALDKVVSGGREVVQLEHGVTSPNGDRRLLSTVSSVRDASQRPLYLFLQVQDVSAQRVVEEELRLSEQRFRLLVEAVQDYAIFMLHPDGRIASWNAGAERIKGWTADEIVGQHFRRFYPADKQAERHPEHELELALRDGHYEEEGWRVRKDGSMFYAQVTITAVRDGEGRLVGFAKVTRDITERMHMLEDQERGATALAQANAALEAANARLSQATADQSHFLAVTAHELRAPVGVLAGSAELLRRHWTVLPESERSELLDGMNASAGRLQRLLTDLLTASRIRSEALAVDLAPVDLGPLLASVVRTVEVGSGTGKIVTDLAPGLTVTADADRLAQMVENLLRNALRHGAPPIVISAEPRDDGAIDLLVRDNGEGVPADMESRLFERFATSSDGGTGLGLYIVRALARAQGGDATYRPEDRTFVITLPSGGRPAGTAR